MDIRRIPRFMVILLAGDAVVLALVTLAGLATHGELGQAGSRLWPTFLPLLAAWLLVAPHLDAFNPRKILQVRSLWRPFWAMLLAAPLGVLLRSLWLGTSAMIVDFVLVMGWLCALALLAWRGLYWVFFHSKEETNG
jgi:Protein of unknown function (DUF3054)